MDFILSLTDPRIIIQTLGLLGILAVIFAESGLFFGFFLPGDSLLFIAGVFASQGYFSFTHLVIGGIIAAILGDNVGYTFGKKVGPKLFTKEDSLFFKKEYALRAQKFYEKHGVKTIILARFVPIVRTFAPIVAGIALMPRKTFMTYNIIGGIVWVTSLSSAGYILGELVPNLDAYIDIIVLGIIALSFVPLIIEYYKEKRHKKNTEL